MKSYPYTNELRWRYRFSILAVINAVILFAWGGFVTSIDAGLAVPDWPSSFNSYDPFTPFPDWWKVVPVLAEHGHRLMGALMGLFTVVLTAWTLMKEQRVWMKKLAVFALVLVIFQGVLGGLRVTLISLDLAVVHACVAQIFFSLLVGMTLFTSRSWVTFQGAPTAGATSPLLRQLVAASTLAVYVQIILGALLRHPGAGINPMFAGIHILGALIVTGLILFTGTFIHRRFPEQKLLIRASRIQMGVLVAQFALGLTAYLVLLDESGMIQPSNFQVIVNTSHLVIGAALMSSTVVLALLALRRLPADAWGDTAPAEPSLLVNAFEPASR